MNRLILGWTMVMALLVSGFAQAKNESNESSVDAITAVLQSQVDAWNHHDLDRFMAGYWNSPQLTFFSGTTETEGWEPTLQRYQRTYQGEGHSMGKLSFSDLKVEPLSADAAFVRGKFQLVMPDGSQPHGVFTLIVRKFPEGWRIIHDHTCSY